MTLGIRLTGCAALVFAVLMPGAAAAQTQQAYPNPYGGYVTTAPGQSPVVTYRSGSSEYETIRRRQPGTEGAQDRSRKPADPSGPLNLPPNTR